MSEKEIKFESLYLSRSYGGEIRGKLKISSDDGSAVEITLPKEPLEALVDLVADQLAQAASIQADRLRCAILNRNNTDKT